MNYIIIVPSNTNWLLVPFKTDTPPFSLAVKCKIPFTYGAVIINDAGEAFWLHLAVVLAGECVVDFSF